jgi:hypothetical protein
MNTWTKVVALLLILSPVGARAGIDSASALLAASLATVASTGTVYTTEGGRVRGTILEAGPSGVSVQIADGSVRKYDAAKVARVDFADGTTWVPTAGAVSAAPAATAAAPAGASGAAAPAATATAAAPAGGAAAAAPAATAAPTAAGATIAGTTTPAAQGAPAAGGQTVAAAAAPTAGAQAAPVAAVATGPGARPAPVPAVAVVPGAPGPAPTPAPAAKEPLPILLPLDRLDVVHLANGGRVRGLVVEEVPSEGVLMRLVDGSERRYKPGEAVLVQYANGTLSVQPKVQATPP